MTELASPTAQLARVGAILELALYGNHDAKNPRSPVEMANQAYDRIRRYERVTDHLVAALAAMETHP